MKHGRYDGVKGFMISRCCYHPTLGDGTTVSMDLESGVSRRDRRTDLSDWEFSDTIDVEDETVEKAMDYIEAAGILKESLEPAKILDGVWYYMTLETAEGPRKIVWNCGNRDVDFSLDTLCSIIGFPDQAESRTDRLFIDDPTWRYHGQERNGMRDLPCAADLS